MVSFFLYGPSTPFPGLAALPPCLGTALLIYAHQSGSSPISKVLCLSQVVFIGKISYSLYLWHWPLLVYGRHFSIHEMSQTMRVSLLVAAFVLSVLTWMFVETPFRKRRLGKERKQLFRFFGIATVVLAGAFTFLYKSDGLPVRFQGDNARFAEVNLETPDAKNLKDDFDEFLAILPDETETSKSFLVWGDSHASRVVHLLRQLSKENGMNGYYACRHSTPPFLGVNVLPSDDTLALFNDRVLKQIGQHEIKRVFLIGRWAKYIHRGQFSREDPISDRDDYGRPSKEVFRDGLERTIHALRKMKIEVVIMKQAPCQHRSPTSTLWMAERFGYDPMETGIKIEKHLDHQKVANEILDSFAGEGVIVIDPLDVLSHPNGHTKVHDGKKIFYSDDNHLSNDGALALRPIFAPFFKPQASD